jgi:hypothetical protein
MAGGGRGDAIHSWLDRLLGRPRKITPFTIEGGGRLVGDPGSPEGAVFEGGTVRILDGWDVEVNESEKTAYLYPSGSTGGASAVGTFNCKCSETVGDCRPYKNPDGTMRCDSDPDERCLGECKLSFKIKRKRFALQIY